MSSQPSALTDTRSSSSTPPWWSRPDDRGPASAHLPEIVERIERNVAPGAEPGCRVRAAQTPPTALASRPGGAADFADRAHLTGEHHFLVARGVGVEFVAAVEAGQIWSPVAAFSQAVERDVNFKICSP
jgi:hypothetical protein